MAIQYDDGTFSGNMPFEEALKQFTEARDDGIFYKALHQGTSAELDEVKKKANVQSRIDELEDRLDKLEVDKIDTNLIIPSKDEIRRFGIICDSERS